MSKNYIGIHVRRFSNGTTLKFKNRRFAIFKDIGNESVNRIHIKALTSEVGKEPGIQTILSSDEKIKETLLNLSEVALFELYISLHKHFEYNLPKFGEETQQPKEEPKVDKIIIDIKFRGIDDFNRPVFKDVKSNQHFGSVDKLFSVDTPVNEIVDYFKENIYQLDLFGNKFNCEPMGGFSHEKYLLNIITHE